jgi:cholestenol delta-isomerase
MTMGSPALNGSLSHPYYPSDIHLPRYVPNDIPTPMLITYFAIAAGFVLWFTSVLARTIRPSISSGDRLAAMWFMLCGCIHFFFEGYFAYNNAQMPSRTHLFGQLWKEYSLSDRRYQTRDSFVVCMEAITAICWGPLSFAISWMIITENPLRHAFQPVVSMGQLYGDVLYYAIFFFDESVYGAVYCRPERVYFWAYFVMMNGFWIVIPLWFIYQSGAEISKAFRTLKEQGKKLKQ